MAAPLRTMVHGPWPEKGCSRPSRSEASLKVLTSLVLVKHRNEFCSSSFFVAPADDRSAWRNPGLDCCLAHSFKTQDLPHGLAGGLRHDSICSSDGCTLHSGSQGEHIESPRGGRSTDKCLARMQGDGSTQPSVLYGMVSCSACSGNGKANLPWISDAIVRISCCQLAKILSSFRPRKAHQCPPEAGTSAAN